MVADTLAQVAAEKARLAFGTLDWTRRMLAELQRRFDAHADGYRAHLDRITAQGGATPLEKETIQRDLDILAQREAAR
jgi:hypothetical protein